MDIVLIAPANGLLTLALAVAEQFAGKAVCLFLPASYLGVTPVPVRVWLSAMADQGRLVVFTSADRVSRMVFLWVIVFVSAEVKFLMTKGSGKCARAGAIEWGSQGVV